VDIFGAHISLYYLIFMRRKGEKMDALSLPSLNVSGRWSAVVGSGLFNIISLRGCFAP
jgi:hypothetical protein